MTLNLKKRIADFQSSGKQGFQYALFFALNIILFFNPISKKNTKVLEFKRLMGNGIANNWDCERVIAHFFALFILFSVLLICFWFIFDLLKRKVNISRSSENKNCIHFLDSFMTFACAVTLFRCLYFFQKKADDAPLFDYATILLYLVALSGFVYLIFRLSKNITFDFYKQILIIFFSFSFCAFTLLKNYKLQTFQLLFLVLIIIAIKIFKNIEKNKICNSYVKSASIVFSFFPLMTSFYFELLNIMNSHNVFVTRIRKYYAIASFLLIFVSVIFAIIVNLKNLKIDFWKRISFPALVLGITFLSVQAPLSATYSADIFEGANLSIPVSDFLNFGKIPVVSHYPGHMMSGVWEAFVYSFLNGDKFGAIFSPYSSFIQIPILVLLFFYFVKAILNEDVALLATILFPFYGEWSYFGMGTLLALAVAAYIKRNTICRAFLVWLSFVWCALYRLDLGFAFFAAAFVSLVIYVLKYKNKTALKQLVFSLLISALAGILLWTVLCLQQKANPVLRLIEFLKLSASNQTWAYPSIGDRNFNFFSWCYFFVPLFCAFSLVVLIFSNDIQKRISPQILILALIFGFSYFFNFQRGLVRHSLVENAKDIVLWSSSIFLALSLSIILKRKNLFFPILAAVILVNANFMNGRIFSKKSIAENVAPKIQENLATERAHKVQRVVFESGMKNYCEGYKQILDKLLNEKETFLDFKNATFIYSAIGRENPVYVAQSPLMLSGEFTQKMFIKEIADRIETVPIALLPLNWERASASLDGIMNNYRNYKVAEFIYTHYKPLATCSDFAIWAENNRYDEIKNKISESEIRVDMNKILVFENFQTNSCQILKNYDDKSFTMKFTSSDPFVSNMHDFVDISSFVGKNVTLAFDYESDTDGMMQLFYTTESGESYSEQKSVRVNIKNFGTATFTFPVTENTRFRLDTPEKSSVKINSITASSDATLIKNLPYDLEFHSYNLAYLPGLWAEKDSKHAAKNKVAAELYYDDSASLAFDNGEKIYSFDSAKIEKTQQGNYLLLKINNTENQRGVSISLGFSDGWNFEKTYDFNFELLPGEHEYIFRISSDYLWFFKNVNAIKVDSNFPELEGAILEAD